MKKVKILKIISTLLTTATFIIYIYYYPAPPKIAKETVFPIAIFSILYGLTFFCISWNFVSLKKACIITLIALSTLCIKIQRFIPIITYAVGIPLLFVNRSKNENSSGEL
jgi:intracellular septation protein A